jgi:ankyrin repeat protein
MSPDDALFDAINRGDIAAARDALSRGAELDARNLLGMTPMELSVDLGRNDISFLLLSYRNPDSGQAASAPASTPASTRVTAATPGAATKTRSAKSAAREPVVPIKAVVPAAPQTPRLFANDGGSPVPAAGFLGFGQGR